VSSERDSAISAELCLRRVVRTASRTKVGQGIPAFGAEFLAGNSFRAAFGATHVRHLERQRL